MIRHLIDIIVHYLPDREFFVRHPGKRAALEVEKEVLRKESLERRRTARDEMHAHATHVVLSHVEKEIPFPEGSVVAGYWPIGRELDARPLLRHLAQHGYKIVLPYAHERGKSLEFRVWHAHEPMEMDHFQVPAPGKTAEHLVPDIILVPLLSFDRQGHRLGYSSGFYDVTLDSLRQQKSILAIGLGFSSQEVPRIPAGGLDQPLDGIVTERGVLDFSGFLKG